MNTDDDVKRDIEAAVATWWKATLSTVAPMISTEAYNALMVARDNLTSILTAAAKAANPE